MIWDGWGWCTAMTQRDGMVREVGGGVRMGNTCTPLEDSCWCMAKPIQYCKVKKKKKVPCIYFTNILLFWNNKWADELRTLHVHICICIAFVFEGTAYLFFTSFFHIFFLRLDIELPSGALGKILNFVLVATFWNPFMCEPYFGFLPFSSSVFRDDQHIMLPVAVNQTKDLENPSSSFWRARTWIKVCIS